MLISSPNRRNEDTTLEARPLSRSSEEPGLAAIHSYRDILKSSVLIGVASLAKIVFGIARVKVMAVLLGPSGVGLTGLYSAIADIVVSVAGMGVNNSGVRQIAVAVSSGNADRIARTATVLRWTSGLLGVLGAVLLLLLARPISIFSFGTDTHTTAVALLSLVVLLSLISNGQAALVQGMRRIADLARMGVLGALFGTMISIVFVYWLGADGIVPSLVAVAALTVLTSCYYSRKLKITAPSMTGAQAQQELGLLLKLGFALMASGLLTMGAAYAIRILVLHRIGLEAAGLYQSAWTLGGLYVGFILQAMGADFYPRLTATAGVNVECNRLVNEQAQVSLLLAGPGVLATLTFAPVVIAFFYSSQFTGAVEVLRWICLGMTLRVIAWPMGFIVLAKGAQKIFFWTEVAATLVHVGLAWIFMAHFGLAGVGAAFFGLYVWHGLLIYWIVGRLSGFRWSPANRKLGQRFFPLIAAVFVGFYLLPGWLVTTLGAMAVIFSGIYSMRLLVDLMPEQRIPERLRRLFRLSY